ncbi:MAG: anti-sigma factor [Phreatobacter sp.]|uniref:anti-sigma factor n=1 Tax=Phreatobacter sp. TaxID=1966341 RepID=UPI001A474B50|nr:anti-sigma factor [Phreatobacter sp.]MBL8567538.1 anti-sigma factor [Phreatobacter sp.]
MTHDLIATAGEYVAGLMTPEELEAFERRIATDAEARRAVADWREKLVALDETATPAAPSESLWPRIEAAIGKVLPAAADRQSWLGRVWADVSALRFAALAGAAAALLLAVVIVTRPFSTAPQPVVVAVLNAPNTSDAGAIVEAYADGRIRVVPLRAIPVPEGRVLQVWTLWDRQVGPRSVGLMPVVRQSDYRTSGMPRPVDSQLYEITLEPTGGSPTGRPTGPILYVGRGSAPL